MPYTVRLNHHIGSFIVMESETILDAALRQNYFIPYSCHEGLCGTCEGQLIEGRVEHYHADDLALDEQELASGKVLLCSATPRSDLLLEVDGVTLPAADTSLAEFEYSLHSLTPLNTQLFQATLRPQETQLAYFAGQYIEVLVPGEDAKPFSIANAPLGEGEIQLHIRYQADNAYSCQLIDTLRREQRLRFRGARGHCLYHPQPEMPTVLIAGGTGFAPLKAIIEQAVNDGLTKAWTLYWTAKTLDDLYLHDLATQWDRYIPHFRYVPVLTGASIPADWSGATGSVYQHIRQQQHTLKDHHVYISGPPSLTYDAFEQLAALELQHYYLYSDVIDYQPS